MENTVKEMKKILGAPQPLGTMPYKVLSNDSLASIAAKTDVSVTLLKKLNRMMTETIFPGQVLFIPGPEYASFNPTTPPSPTDKQMFKTQSTSVNMKSTSIPTTSKKHSNQFELSTSPLKSVPGHVERQQADQVKSKPLALPRKLSEDEAKKIDEECHERFVKMDAKYITQGGDEVDGVLLVTPDGIMFDPDENNHLIQKNGREKYCLVESILSIVLVAVYHDTETIKYSRFIPKSDDSTNEGRDDSESKEISSADDDLVIKDDHFGQTFSEIDDVLSSCALDGDTERNESRVKVGGMTDSKPLMDLECDMRSTKGVNKQDIVTVVAVVHRDATVLEENSEQKADQVSRYDAQDNSKKLVEGNAEDNFEHETGVSVAELGTVPVIEGYSKQKNTNNLKNAADAELENIDATKFDDDTKVTNLVKRENAAEEGNIIALAEIESKSFITNTIEKQEEHLNDSTTIALVRNVIDLDSFDENDVKTLVSTKDETKQEEMKCHFDDLPSPINTHFQDPNEIQGSSFSQSLSKDLSEEEKNRRSLKIKDEMKRQDDKDSFSAQQSTNSVSSSCVSQVKNNFDLSKQKGCDILQTCPEHLLNVFLFLKIHKNVEAAKAFYEESLSTVRGPVKSEYWYSIPRDKVDRLFAFFIQWSHEDGTKGFVVVDADRAVDYKTINTSDGQKLVCEIINDWQIVNYKEFQRMLSEAEIKQLPLPELSEQSQIMGISHISLLICHLPAIAEGSPWHLVYSTAKHGFSLKSLYRHMSNVDSPILLVIQDDSDQVFGAMISCTLKLSEHFYGSGESYLFTYYPEFKKFGWTGINSFFVKGNKDSLAVGAGKGSNGLWIDGDLYHGRTQICQTFDNDLLTVSQDFTIKCLETWCFI